MKAKYLQLNEQKIAYYESSGSSTTLRGSAIFFIHGNSSSSLAFERQFNSSLVNKFRLVTIDLLGHGKSSNAANPESTYTLPGYASIVLDVAKKLGVEDAVFVGWSLGGHVLLEAAEQLTKAKGFVIFGAPPTGVPPDIAGAYLSNPAIPILFKAEPTNKEIDLWCNTLGKQLPDFFKDDILASDGRARTEMGKSIAQCNYKDEIKVIEKLSSPLAIFHGEEDKLINLKYINKLSMPTLWRDEVQVISNTGHLPQWEQPEKFNALLEKFLGDLC